MHSIGVISEIWGRIFSFTYLKRGNNSESQKLSYLQQFEEQKLFSRNEGINIWNKIT